MVANADSFLRRRERMQELAGPAFGGSSQHPDRDPDDKDQNRVKRWLKHLYHSLYCWWINCQYPHPKNDAKPGQKNR